MTTAITSRVEIKVEASVARVKLVNSPLNVIDQQMARELNDALIDIEARTDVSVILFEGDARAFSAGVDIKAHLPDQIHEMLASLISGNPQVASRAV